MVTKLLLLVMLFGNNLGLRYLSDSELNDFCKTLLTSDTNNVANFINLNIQGKAKYGENIDVAPERLMTVSKQAYNPKTIAKMLPLYDNYEADSTKTEIVTNGEVQEENALLDAMFSTSVMLHTKTLLQSKDLAPKDDRNYRNFIHDLWFTIFARSGRKKGSSGFEHIFLGEFKRGDISGLHNWLFFDHEESKGRLNYMGWTRKMDLPYGKGSVLKLRYSWENITKPAGSMFVGTSPEFDMAMYTVCFLARPNDRCNLSVDGKNFFIQTYSLTKNNKTIIGSAYPGI